MRKRSKRRTSEELPLPVLWRRDLAGGERIEISLVPARAELRFTGTTNAARMRGARAPGLPRCAGGKAIILARFAPIVRTFVPFVAGVGSMTYSKFAFYNVTGAILWVGICTGAGYAFGNVPVVKDNFSLVALGIVAVSLIPMAVEMMRGWKASQAPS